MGHHEGFACIQLAIGDAGELDGTERLGESDGIGRIPEVVPAERKWLARRYRLAQVLATPLLAL